MINIICEVSKYLVLLFMVLYTVKCFSVLSSKNEEQKRKKLNKQIGYVFIIHFLCYLILYPRLGQLKILIFYAAQIFVAILYMVLYHSIYKDSSRLLTNNAAFLLLIGYTMLTRLNFNLAVKQFIFATVGLVITAFIPYIMLKWKKMKDCGVLYGVIGLIFLLTVFIPGLGSEKYGSRNWIQIGSLSIQPMEFVKILFVFFVASMLVKASTFKELFVNAIISAARRDIIGATLYMVGKDVKTGQILEKIDSCIMCKRVVINAGIKYVVVKDVHSDTGYKIMDVNDWIKFDEVLENNKKILFNK